VGCGVPDRAARALLAWAGGVFAVNATCPASTPGRTGGDFATPPFAKRLASRWRSTTWTSRPTTSSPSPAVGARRGACDGLRAHVRLDGKSQFL